MKNIFLLGCFLLLSKLSIGQNLVYNPGFEEHGETAGNGAGTDNMKLNHVKKWSSPNAGSPDYYLKGSDYLRTQYGFPKYHTGDAMAGAVVFGGKKEYREYIMGELAIPLEEGKEYQFSISVALASYCSINVSELGIYFSNDKISDKKSAALKVVPQIIIDSMNQSSLEGAWVVFHETYLAKGGEKFITIGNFSIDKKTKNAKSTLANGSLPYAYYYFDDISLIPAESEKKNEPMLVPIKPVSSIDENPAPVDTLKIAAGKKLIVQNVYFEVDQSVLKPESFPILDEIILALRMQPELKVQIDGHTDSDGTPDHNLKLSQERAKAVANYFMERGIDSSRLSTNGYGSTKPISTDKNKNRRVEFTFF